MFSLWNCLFCIVAAAVCLQTFSILFGIVEISVPIQFTNIIFDRVQFPRTWLRVDKPSAKQLLRDEKIKRFRMYTSTVPRPTKSRRKD